MATLNDPGEEHSAFTQWAISRGVRVEGVRPSRIPRRGLGIVAETEIHEAGQGLVFVPISALLTINNVPKSFKEKIGSISVHGLLAAFLVHGPESRLSTYAPWAKVWPSLSDFTESNPLLWPEILQRHLPPVAQEILDKQKKKFKTDFAAVRKAFPNSSRDDFMHAWMVVNTRTFYYVPRGMKKPPPPDDCLALCPFADYFNHTDEGCPVTFDAKGYTVSSDKPYKSGEEIYVSYGNHSNDFLLVEYGFILSSNKWDEFLLDDVILPKLSQEQKDHLREAGFLGKYVVDGKTVCYRTQVVVRILLLSLYRWRRFVNGQDDGTREQAEVNKMIFELLVTASRKATTSGQATHIDLTVNGYNMGSGPYSIIMTRWRQIADLLSSTVAQLKNN